MNDLTIFFMGIVIIIICVVIIEYTCRCNNKKYSDFKACVINLARRRERMLNFDSHF